MALSIQTNEILGMMGKMVEVGRRQRGWSEQELATRAQVSRNTVRKVLSGDPTVSAGVMFECAYLVGIDLLGDASTRRQESLRIQGFLEILPKRKRKTIEMIDDNF